MSARSAARIPKSASVDVMADDPIQVYEFTLDTAIFGRVVCGHSFTVSMLCPGCGVEVLFEGAVRPAAVVCNTCNSELELAAKQPSEADEDDR